ncbi:hypothetical protein LMG29542_08542 [Paraburkholderia humisilvae]|uniref:Uncharacterized protein n=1 Tax=Paraburkholderia humisilvae TaxID=627669 RepID=A0A6J5F8I5_9BURK|nr:hypothetical protein LMG29542_08542 [Paraburkholderia humisilvae]
MLHGRKRDKFAPAQRSRSRKPPSSNEKPFLLPFRRGRVRRLTGRLFANKSAPNEENFAATVNARLASSLERCLPAMSWPASSEPSDHVNPYAFYDTGMAFAKAGLATVEEARPNSSTTAKGRFFRLPTKGEMPRPVSPITNFTRLRLTLFAGGRSEQRPRHLCIAEHTGPLGEAQVGGDDDAGAFIELA